MAVGAPELIKVQVFVDGRLEKVMLRRLSERRQPHGLDLRLLTFPALYASVRRQVGLQGGIAPFPETPTWIPLLSTHVYDV